MHVSIFVHRYPPAVGGAEQYAAWWAEHLASRGHQAHVWTTTAQHLTELWYGRGKEGQPRQHYKRERRREAVIDRYPPWQWPARLRPLRRWLLKGLSLGPHPLWRCWTVPCNPICPGMWRAAGTFAGPVDAVHAIAFPYAFVAACAWRLARRRGVPLLLTPFLHLGNLADPADRTRRAYTASHLRWLLRQADAIVTVTEAERQAVLQSGIAAGRVHRLPLGIDVAACTGGDRQRARQQWGVAADETVIGHLANLSAEKGSIDLLEACRILQERGRRFRVVLAGPAMPNFERYWRRYPWPQRVLRLGPLDQPHKRDFFAGIDLFALPSRSDAFGLVLLEAWANGRPNVAYHAGGPAEIIRPGVDGLTVPCGDTAALADALARLIDAPAWRRQLGANGRARLRQGEFRRETHYEALCGIIAGLRDRSAAVSTPH